MLILSLIPQGFYYFAIVEDLALRFIWVLSFYLTEMKIVSSDIMTSITGILEVFRWVFKFLLFQSPEGLSYPLFPVDSFGTSSDWRTNISTTAASSEPCATSR